MSPGLRRNEHNEAKGNERQEEVSCAALHNMQVLAALQLWCWHVLAGGNASCSMQWFKIVTSRAAGRQETVVMAIGEVQVGVGSCQNGRDANRVKSTLIG